MLNQKENPSMIKHIQLAREHAYLGMYKEAQQKFQEAINMLQGTMLGYKGNQGLYSELNILKTELLDEQKMCTDLYTMVYRGEVVQDSAQRDVENFQKEQIVKNELPFNQVPFSHHHNPQGFGAQPIQRNVGNQGQPNMYNQPPSNVQYINTNNKRDFMKVVHPTEDPDVWGPPPPRNKKITNNNNNKKRTTSNTSGSGPGPIPVQQQAPQAQGVKQKDGKNRDYEKPWQVPDKDKKKKKKEDEHSEFLLHCYPDGKGPDVELIQMLERDIVDKNPNVSFDDIASLYEAKQILKETVLLPLLMPDYFKGIREPRKGVLLFGPPGTGKTMLAKGVATFGKTTFMNVHASTLASKWKGDSEKLVRVRQIQQVLKGQILFEMARFYAPTTIFFDEIDSIASARDGNKADGDGGRKVKSELLVQIDGAGENEDEEGNRKAVIILGATNLPWDLDSAVVRRLDKRIYIPLPDKVARKELLKIMLKNEKMGDVNIDKIVDQTEMFSGDDIKNLCRDASMAPLRRWMMTEGFGLDVESIKFKEQELKETPISQADFEYALKSVKASNGPEHLQKYKDWMDSKGSA